MVTLDPGKRQMNSLLLVDTTIEGCKSFPRALPQLCVCVSRLVTMVCIWCTRSLGRLYFLDLLLSHNALIGGILPLMNTASKLGPHTQTDRGTCPGVGL